MISAEIHFALGEYDKGIALLSKMKISLSTIPYVSC